MPRVRVFAISVGLAAAFVTSVEAQSEAGRLIAQARAEIEDLNWDSALVHLRKGLDASPTDAERVRAYILLGAADVNQGNRLGGRQWFERAVRLDQQLTEPLFRADSLSLLHSDAPVVFGEARTAVAPVLAPSALRAALAVALDLPADTSVSPWGGGIWIETRPSYAARVEAIISSVEDRATAVWSEIAPMGGAHTSLWNLRDRSGALVRPGRYSLRATATDSAGVVSLTIERILLVSRVRVDTQALPAPPTFAPESLRLRGSPTSMLLGLALGAAAVALPMAAGSPDLNAGLVADQTVYAVAGAVSLAGIIGFLAGHRVRSIPANIQRNRESRERYEYNRAQITQLNARVLENAPVHVQVEGPGR